MLLGCKWINFSKNWQSWWTQWPTVGFQTNHIVSVQTKRLWASQEEFYCTEINGKSNSVRLRVLLLQILRATRGWKTTQAEIQIINLYWFRSYVMADIMQGDFQLWVVIDVSPYKNNATVAATPSPILLLAYYVLLFLKLMTAIHFKVVHSRHWDTSIVCEVLCISN